METLVVPARDLSDNLVASLFRSYMTTQNPFVGDILARHAPHTTQQLSQGLSSPMQLYAIECAYQSELQTFTRGLIQAILDDSIIQNTQWGALQTHRQDMVERFMRENTAAWNDPLPQLQNVFYFSVLDPFTELVSGYWITALRNAPWLLWYGSFTPDGSLVVQPGDDYRIAAWDASHPQGLQPYVEQLQHDPQSLDAEFDLINAACLNEANKHRFEIQLNEGDFGINGERKSDPISELVKHGRIAPMEVLSYSRPLSSEPAVNSWRDGIIVRVVTPDLPDLPQLKREGALGELDERLGPPITSPSATVALQRPATKAVPKSKKS